MRKILVATIAAGCLYGQSAFAGEYTAQWKGSPEATSYLVELSTDGGVTWKVVYEGPELAVKLTLSEVGLHLLRVASRNGAGVNIRFDRGAWVRPEHEVYNGHISIK